jgi:hypothetical protein
MRKKVLIVVALLMLFAGLGSAITALASTGLTDGPVDSKSMIPLRQAFNHLGAYVEWDPETRTIIVEFYQKDLGILVDVAEKVALYNGKQYFFENDLQYIDNRLHVEAAFIETLKGAKLEVRDGFYRLVEAPK